VEGGVRGRRPRQGYLGEPEQAKGACVTGGKPDKTTGAKLKLAGLDAAAFPRRQGKWTRGADTTAAAQKNNKKKTVTIKYYRTTNKKGSKHFQTKENRTLPRVKYGHKGLTTWGVRKKRLIIPTES